MKIINTKLVGCQTAEVYTVGINHVDCALVHNLLIPALNSFVKPWGVSATRKSLKTENLVTCEMTDGTIITWSSVKNKPIKVYSINLFNEHCKTSTSDMAVKPPVFAHYVKPLIDVSMDGFDTYERQYGIYQTIPNFIYKNCLEPLSNPHKAIDWFKMLAGRHECLKKEWDIVLDEYLREAVKECLNVSRISKTLYVGFDHIRNDMFFYDYFALHFFKEIKDEDLRRWVSIFIDLALRSGYINTSDLTHITGIVFIGLNDNDDTRYIDALSDFSQIFNFSYIATTLIRFFRNLPPS